jgi:hypothetical protein
LVYAASETWVGALLEKAFTRTAHVFRKVKLHLTRRCSTVPLRSTGQVLSRTFVNLLRKFLSQKYNLKPAAELNVKYLSFYWFIVVVNAAVFFVPVFTLRESRTWKNRSRVLLLVGVLCSKRNRYSFTESSAHCPARY